MTRAGSKIPFPMPTTGVVADQHPFAVTHGQLALSQNWLNDDGIFRTRNGLLSLDPPKRWWELINLEDNLVPLGLAEGDYSGIDLLNYDTMVVTVTQGALDTIVGDHQYLAEVPYPTGLDTDVRTDVIDAEPGIDYTAWVFAGEDTQEGDITLEFLNSGDEVLEAYNLTGDLIAQGLWKTTQFAPPQTAGLRLRFYPTYGHDVSFGPMKVSHSDTIYAWTYGEGYSGDPGQNLFDIAVAHPEDSQEANEVWEGIHGKEQIVSYTGQEPLSVFDAYESLPILGRAVAYAAQPTRYMPSYEETTGLLLRSDYRVAVTPGTQYKISASFFFGVEDEPIVDMEYAIEVPFYNAAGVETTFRTVVTSSPVFSPSAALDKVRERAELSFVPTALTTHVGLRVRCICPTAEREIVYDENGNITYNNLGQIVTIENDNLTVRRLGIVLEDVKLVAASGSDPRWWDFVMPTISHSGPYDDSEYAMNYMLHDYLYEGATESNRIVMASNHSVWKWDDTTDTWEKIGFDLGTIYSSFYQVTTSAVTGEDSYTLDERFLFEQTDPEGYTAQPGEEEELNIEIEIPAASEGSTTPYPGGWWKYRVNEGTWSSEMTLTGTTPVLESAIEYNGRTLPVKIVLDVTDYTDFDDICVIPAGETLANPTFSARIVSRHHDGEVGETCFNTDRDGPVDLRGYDYAQKTYTIYANPNDRVTAWDGQVTSKVERAGSNAPFAKTICISGGRVLAGNVRFADPYTDLVAPSAVVYTDTFLSQGFRNWHPELAIRLADTAGEIVKLLEMGTLSVSCYKTDAVYMLVYQTGNNPFRTQLMASNIPGPVAVRAAVPLTENAHLYLAQDGGIYMFDGSYPRSFSRSISNTIQSELDLTYKNRAFMAYSPSLNAALAMYPTKGSEGKVNRGMWVDLEKKAGWPFEWDGTIFDFTAGAPVQTISAYEMGGVTIRLGHMGSSLAAAQALQPDFFMGTADGTTYVMDETAGDDWHNAVHAIFRSGLTEFGLQDRFSVLKELEFIVNRANSPHTMNVEIWASEFGTDAKIVSRGTIDIAEDGPYSVEVREKARFWGYGIDIEASEQIVFNGGFGSVKALGYR